MPMSVARILGEDGGCSAREQNILHRCGLRRRNGHLRLSASQIESLVEVVAQGSGETRSSIGSAVLRELESLQSNPVGTRLN